jgi:hypothetical protein
MVTNIYLLDLKKPLGSGIVEELYSVQHVSIRAVP